MKYHPVALALVVAFAAFGACGDGSGPGSGGAGGAGSGGGSASSGGAGGSCPAPDHWACCKDGLERAPVCGPTGNLHCLKGWRTDVAGHCGGGSTATAGGASMGGAGGASSSITSASTATATATASSSLAASSSASGSGGGGPTCDPVTCRASCAPLCGTCTAGTCGCAPGVCLP